MMESVGSGGGIWIEGTLTSEVAIIDVNIESNTSKSGGGGVYLGSKGELYMEGVQIRQNETAGNGGGLLQVDGVLTAQSIACTDNKAGVDGGGFHLEGKVQNLALVSLSGNTALGSYNGGFITKNADVQQYTPPAGGKVTIFADGSIEFTNT